jgi:hypothetical protein
MQSFIIYANMQHGGLDMVKNVIEQCMQSEGITKAELHRYINENLPNKVALRTVLYWVEGKTRRPNKRILSEMITTYPAGDWRHALAEQLRGEA